MSDQAGAANRSFLVASACVAAAVLVAAWLLAQPQTLSLNELESRYATTESRFMDLDGVRVHYRDEGSGPAVVLLHASFMELRSWDSLADALAKTHRVVRLDFLASGLTGPEPNDKYSFERNLELVDELTRRLELSEFAIVSTSSGGIVGFNFAARYPERVTRLVLVNSAGLPRNAATNPNRARGNPLMNWFTLRFQPRVAARRNLDLNFIEPFEPPEWFVDMSYDMSRRQGLRREASILFANFKTGNPQEVLARVNAPTLVAWGLENQTVFHLEADVFHSWLTGAPSLVKKYPGVGHYLYMEIPDQFASDIEGFLAGRFDQQLSVKRVTPFMPAAQEQGSAALRESQGEK